jgi:uncharacterized protein (TIGR02300 family)
VANPELGAKQVCPNCQAKFYDLNRRPAHCPKCATEFDPEEALKLRNRRGRPAGLPDADDEAEDQVKDKKADGDEDEEEETVVTPEIDQEGHEPILTPDDEDEDAKDPTEEPGMGEAGEDDLADDDDDSVPFIEDEDDDDSFEDEIVKPGDDED